MYRVSLQQFEGPMDLLLFFIRRDELDVYDIPIAQIADEYLAYVRLLEEIDLDGVADFIYMAALLINIKARMLLPSDVTDEDGEVIDPRRELIERLLEYVRFKEASDRLAQRRDAVNDLFPRGEAGSDKEEIRATHEVEIDAFVYDLVKALGHILRSKDENETVDVHEVEPLRYSVDEQQAYVLERLSQEARVAFSELAYQRSKPFVIATFLAVLELARQQHLFVELQGEAVEDFVLVTRDDGPLMEEDPARISGPASSSPQARESGGEGTAQAGTTDEPGPTDETNEGALAADASEGPASYETGGNGAVGGAS